MKPKQIKIIPPTSKQQEDFCKRCNEVYTALLAKSINIYALKEEQK